MLNTLSLSKNEEILLYTMKLVDETGKGVGVRKDTD